MKNGGKFWLTLIVIVALMALLNRCYGQVIDTDTMKIRYMNCLLKEQDSIIHSLNKRLSYAERYASMSDSIIWYKDRQYYTVGSALYLDFGMFNQAQAVFKRRQNIK